MYCYVVIVYVPRRGDYLRFGFADSETRALLALDCFTAPNTGGRLDLAVLFTPSTPNKQNRNQVSWNICAGVRQSTPSSEVV